MNPKPAEHETEAHPLRVALDATPLAARFGGVRRYVQELSQALRQRHPVWLATDQPVPEADFRPRNRLERRWWSVGLERRLAEGRIDVFHGTDFAVPYLSHRATILTVHDLSPWRYPAETSARVRRRTAWLLQWRVPTLVVTPTEAVRHQVIDRFHFPPDRIFAVPLGADHVPELPAAARSDEWLMVGSYRQRKNVEAAVAAFREQQRRGSRERLLLVGAGLDRFAGEGIAVRDDMEDAELWQRYQKAVGVLYLSAYEGFGLPVLEAMRAGAPVIISRDAALGEVAAGAALSVDPHDAPSLAAAWDACRRRRDELVPQGRLRAAEFTWARCAARMSDLYREATARRSRG